LKNLLSLLQKSQRRVGAIETLSKIIPPWTRSFQGSSLATSLVLNLVH